MIPDDVLSESGKARRSWDEYWRFHLGDSAFGKLLPLIRTKLIARSVRYFVEFYFEEKGIFLEAGSGSSQTSALIRRKDRRLYCLDFSMQALSYARKIPVIAGGLQGDLFFLPLRGGSVDGLWNLGVMEHFTDPEIDLIFKEYFRVLKPGGCALLFWPPLWGWYKLSSVAIEKMLGFIKGKMIKLYPNEVNLFRSKKKIRTLCQRHGFTLEHCGAVWRDLYTYTVVVICKKASDGG